MPTKLPYDTPSDVETDPYGTSLEVDESDLETTTRAVNSISQAISLTDLDIKDARRLIVNASRITNKKNGDKPYNTASLTNQGKAWKTNISTGAFATELRRTAPRFYMPILTASTLTAAELPAGWPRGQEKTEFFRETVTRAIRSWKKWDFYMRGLAQEVVDYGFAFPCFTDPYEWRPHLVRMDKGFVPRGSEIMDENLARFTLTWEYEPSDLLELARTAVDAGIEGWNKEGVAMAVSKAAIPPTEWTMEKSRRFEDLIREQSYDMTYFKGAKVIKTRHLFVLEGTGKVSHYLLWPDGKNEDQLLMERLDAYDSMDDVVIPMVFGYGDGTIHGSWGAGHLIYDIAAQLEKIRCDSMDNLRLSNKMKLQVPNAKDINNVKLVVNDTMVIASEAQFANNIAGTTPNPDGYIRLEQQMTQWMQQRLGAFVPPIPSQPSDIKAAQINAAMAQEQEIQQDVLEAWLKQCAYLIRAMTKRLCDKESTDSIAVQLRAQLLGEENWWQKTKNFVKKALKAVSINVPSSRVSLTEEEIELLVNQPAVQTVADFTAIAIQRRAAFAQSVLNNPLFNQTNVAKLMATGAGGRSLSEYLVIPQEDNSQQTEAQRQQLEEVTTMLNGVDIPVVPKDNHWVHMQTLKQPLEAMIANQALKAALPMFRHYAAHYQAGVSLRTLPPEVVNSEKSVVSKYEKAISAIQQQQQAAAAQAAQQQALAAQAGGVPPGAPLPQPGPAPVPPPPDTGQPPPQQLAA